MANTVVSRYADRACYERESVYAILDQAYVAHVGVVVDGAPVVLPYACARVGDELVLHGSRFAGVLSAIASGTPLCATVTHVDGLVLARSAFHSSMNYRSAVVHGAARVISDQDEKRRCLDAYVDRILPNRRAALRPMSDGELEATQVVAIPLDTVSAKVRTGGPKEPQSDQRGDVWAGVIPLSLVAGVPEADAATVVGVSVPRIAR